MGKATLMEYQENGVPKVEWLTAGDADVREEHALNAAQGPIPVGTAFANGEHYPGESSVHCRCALAPVVL